MGKKGTGMVYQQQWQAKGGGFPAAGACGVAREQELMGIEAGSSCSSNMAMKDPLARTKVLVRRLPPTLTKQAFVAQIEGKFAKTYSWLAFRPGKLTHRNQVHSRAYIDFNSPADVVAFHEDFDGHVFVNEKGTQYKASVEYAPCQRVPNLRLRKDAREGTILTDPDYLVFLEGLGKPTELLPSADIQLERREAERLGMTKEGPIVTPLMEFVRQKRAAKLQKAAKRAPPHPNFVLQKRGENGKSVTPETRRERHKRKEAAEFKKFSRETFEDLPEEEKKDWKLSKEKEKSEAVSPGYGGRGRYKSNYRDRTGRGTSPKESDTLLKSVDNGNGPDGRRVRNKDRPDRPVWTPRRLQETDSVEGTQNGKGHRGPRQGRVGGQDVHEPEDELDGRNGSFENGTYRFRKVSKDPDCVSEAGRQLKRGAAPFGNSEKQVWVAKTG